MKKDDTRSRRVKPLPDHPTGKRPITWQNRTVDPSKRAMLCVVMAATSSMLHTTAAGQPAANAAAGDNAIRAAAARSGGIWKAAVPPTPMKGEFDSLDPVGVAVGARIKADCSLNWIDPDHGKRFCFSSGTSLEYFLDQPQANIERARRAWKKMASKRK
jgi:hypothetical protein